MVIEELANRLLHEPKDESKPIITSVIGIRDVIMVGSGVVLHQGLDLFRGAPQIEQISDILLVHADEKAVVRKIISRDLPRTCHKIYPMTTGDRPAPGIRQITGMPASDAC